MPSLRRRPRGLIPVAVLAIIPAIVVLVAVLGPLRTDFAYKYSGLAYDAGTRILAGEPTIDGNVGVTSQALGTRAARDVLSGRLPLWNHFEGLGAPLLGEMQSAALFPPTWLMVLPHGQAIEQALLQLVAGLGTFLFLRRLGLGTGAALAGGLLFEVNGVFAWLRNAVTNPVALLPWLFLGVELLRGSAVTGIRAGRARSIAITAVAAALALYAGFPEEVYLYGLLLIVWTLFRAASLARPQIGRFALDLALTGLLCAALSAPVLAAFVDYLPQAELGGHGGSGFGSLGAGALSQYILPYIYGTIFHAPEQSVTDLWEGTGGYIGFMPVVLAAAGLPGPRRRPMKLVLFGWIVLALGATHGMPVLDAAFHALPLMGIVAVYRYLDTSWIFCFVILAALFLDEAARLTPQRRRATLALGTALGLACVGLALAANAPMLHDIWAGSTHHRRFGLAAVTTGALVAVIGGSALVERGRVAALALAGTLVLEAATWFAVPYLSYPRHGHLDLDLVSFLKAEAGFGRILAVEAGLFPNYGSAIGVALLNYDDLPAPTLTADVVQQDLDPYAGRTAFPPSSWGLSPEQRLDRRNTRHTRLAAYGRVGVKFILAGDGFDRVPLYEIDTTREAGVVPLPAGGAVSIEGQVAATLALPVSAVSTVLGDGPQASGHLRATLCVGEDCASGTVDLGDIRDRLLTIALDHSVVVPAGGGYTLGIARPDGDGALALPLHPVSASDAAVAVRDGSGPARSDAAPDLRVTDARLSLAYSGRSTQVYRLDGVRDYLSAPGCRITPVSRDALTASCEGPSRLTRLELALRGWSATVDGASVPITPEDRAFQAIALPAGDSRIVFAYAPRGFGWALAAALLGLLAVTAIIVGAYGHPPRSVLRRRLVCRGKRPEKRSTD